MELLEALAPELVLLDLEAEGKDALLERLAGEVARVAALDDAPGLYKKILERESVMSTGIGSGVALPHAKHERLTRIWLAFARTATPVDYKALDGRPVDLLFLLAGPPAESAQHVKLLGKLARLLKKPEFTGALREIKHGADLPALIRLHERA